MGENAAIDPTEPTNAGPRQVVRALVVIVLLLCGGAWWFLGGSAEQRNLEQVRQSLIDPWSAQFEEVNTVGDRTCGLVNAKNRMGAYTGFELFTVDAVVDTGMAAVAESNKPEWKGVCTLAARIR